MTIEKEESIKDELISAIKMVLIKYFADCKDSYLTTVADDVADWMIRRHEDEEDECREEVYQQLNDGGYGLSASKAHSLQLWLFRNYLISKEITVKK